jgi:hypothetical protein
VASVAQVTSVRPAAASTALRALLVGPAVSGRVLGAFPAAMYVGLDTPHAGTAAPVIAVVAPEAVRLPNALVVPGAWPWSARTEGVARVGDGELAVGEVVLRPVRWWAPARAHALPTGGMRGLGAHAARLQGHLDARGAALSAEVAAALSGLSAACLRADISGALAAADRLLGLGAGLTPAGDDVLAGLLLSLGHLGPPEAATVLEFLRRHVATVAASRTTTVSAALLEHATRGEAAPEVVAVLDALCGHGELGPAVDALLCIGHTSGGDLAHGLLAGVGAALPSRAAA